MKSKFVIGSTANFDQINKAPTNRSTTKKTFSFSKTSRFEEPKPTCPINTYGGELQNKKGSGTGIGYGNRSDFTKCLTVSPSSSSYNIRSFWDENLKHKKGSGFALSRDKVSFNQYIPKQPLAVPAASQYNNEKPVNKWSAPKYSLRQKTTVIDKKMTIDPQNKNPGPGSYINPQLESQPSFKHISKFQILSYGQSKSKRFLPSETLAPGPGKYKEVNELSKNGNYILSQSKGGTKAKFDGERRVSMFDKVFKKELEKPGPGYYQAPSQFGQYDGEIYQDLRQGKRSKNGWDNLSDRKIPK